MNYLMNMYIYACFSLISVFFYLVHYVDVSQWWMWVMIMQGELCLMNVQTRIIHWRKMNTENASEMHVSVQYKWFKNKNT